MKDWMKQSLDYTYMLVHVHSCFGIIPAGSLVTLQNTGHSASINKYYGLGRYQDDIHPAYDAQVGFGSACNMWQYLVHFSVLSPREVFTPQHTWRKISSCLRNTRAYRMTAVLVVVFGSCKTPNQASQMYPNYECK